MKRADRSLVLVVLLLMLVHLYAAFFPSAPIRDAGEYQWAAQNLAESGHAYAGDPAQVDMRLHSKRPPFFPLLLMFAGVWGAWGATLLQASLLLLLYVSGSLLLKKARSTHALRIYRILFLLSLPLFFTTTFGLADLLLAVLICQMLYFGVLFWKHGRFRYVLILSVLWSMALLTKPVMLPSILAIPLILLGQKRRWQGAYVLAMPFVVVLALFVYNQRFTGTYHYSSISTINRSFYNARLTIAHVYGADSARAYTDDPAFAIPTDKAEFRHYQHVLNTRANQTLLSHPSAYLRIHLLGMLKGLADPGRFEIYNFLSAGEPEQSLTAAIWAGSWQEVRAYLGKQPIAASLLVLLFLLQLVKLLGFALSWRHWRGLALLYSLVVGYFLVLAGPIAAFRFLIPAYIPFLLLSSIGLTELPHLLKKGPVR